MSPAQAAQGVSALAGTPAADAATAPRQYLSFQLDGHIYAVPLAQVAEITPLKELNRIPHMPKCVEGLLNHPGHIMILSTHLYEVAQQFSANDNILFAYFVTQMASNGDYEFTYELKPGISNDRIGYRILQKEGVISLLEQKQYKG